MKKTALLMALTALFLLPVGDAHASRGSLWETGIGAALGGYIGSTIGKGRGNLAATAAGTFIGANIGHAFAQSRRSHHYVQRPHPATYYTPRHHHYRPNYVAPITSVQPARPIYEDSYKHPRAVHVDKGYMGKRPQHMRRLGRHCRDFTQTIRIDGQIKESYGIACMRPDGSWQIQ